MKKIMKLRGVDEETKKFLLKYKLPLIFTKDKKEEKVKEVKEVIKKIEINQKKKMEAKDGFSKSKKADVRGEGEFEEMYDSKEETMKLLKELGFKHLQEGILQGIAKLKGCDWANILVKGCLTKWELTDYKSKDYIYSLLKRIRYKLQDKGFSLVDYKVMMVLCYLSQNPWSSFEEMKEAIIKTSISNHKKDMSYPLSILKRYLREGVSQGMLIEKEGRYKLIKKIDFDKSLKIGRTFILSFIEKEK